MRGNEIRRAKKVPIVIVGFKCPPLTLEKQTMRSESVIQLVIPPINGPKNAEVAEMPAAVVAVVGCAGGCAEIHIVINTNIMVPRNPNQMCNRAKGDGRKTSTKN
jgi:hypothetical protein